MKRSFYIISTLILCLIAPFNIYGQIDSIPQPIDSVFIKAGEYVYINNQLTFISNDTTLFPNKDLIIRKINDKNKKSEQFYENLQTKAEQKKITTELYDLFVKDYGPTGIKKDKISTSEFEKFIGKEINSIRIKRLDVFGPSFTDTSRIASTKLSEKANNFHVKTLPGIIKNNLLIKKGDIVDPFLLADNERIIRKLPYIKDSKFILTPSKADTNKVDLLVLTQDVWSLGIEGNLTGIDAGYIEVFDKNMFGTGHQQNNLFEYDPSTVPLYGYEGGYSIPNINGTFINTSIFYQHNNNRERYGAAVDRKFISPEIKYGGGLQLIKELWYEGYITDTNLNVTPQNHIIEDLWFGRSILLIENLNQSYRKNLFITTRLINDSYQFVEPGAFDSTLRYLDNRQVYLNFGIAKTKYFKGSLISSFGKTEDIPVGYMFDVKVGYHFDETGPRMCLGTSFSIANFKAGKAYLHSSIQAGSFFNNKKYEQAIVKFQLNYFSRIFKLFNYQTRQFIKVNYIAGFNRRPYEKLTINNYDGIRQFKINDLYGDKKFTITFENVVFTPLNLYGFRFALFSFIDLGVIGNNMDFIYSNKYYTGIGIGVRIRNENLVFKTLELKFIVYPTSPDNHNGNSFVHIANERGFSFQNFNIKQPDVTIFK